jgi:aryl-alcohol dehydrogenase-like predicted oxidoreductase
MNKLALGTAQFGLDYGISNTTGKIAFEEAIKILNILKINNIDTLDTAYQYGNSEEMLGKIGVSNFHIVTKTAPLKFGIRNVIKSFHQSLKNLNISSVDGLLVHNIDEVQDYEFEDLYIELLKLKQDKLINKIGFSAYMPEQVDFLLNNFDFDLIQVPINVFDTRLIDNGQLVRLKNKKIEVHARSIFLQGLLLNFMKLDDYFFQWSNEFNNYQEIVKASNLSLLEYALNFVISILEVDKVLVGVNSESELIEITNASLVNNNVQAYPLSDLKLLNPNLWKI